MRRSCCSVSGLRVSGSRLCLGKRVPSARIRILGLVARVARGRIRGFGEAEDGSESPWRKIYEHTLRAEWAKSLPIHESPCAIFHPESCNHAGSRNEASPCLQSSTQPRSKGLGPTRRDSSRSLIVCTSPHHHHRYPRQRKRRC